MTTIEAPDDFDVTEAPELPALTPMPQTAEAPYGYTKTGRVRKRPIGSRAGGTRRTASKTPTVDIQAGMTEVYEGVGLLALARGDQELALMLIGEQRLKELLSGTGGVGSLAQSAGTAWSKVADQNPWFNQKLTKLLQTGVWAELVQAHIPLAMLAMRRKPVKLRLLKSVFKRKARTGRVNGQAPS